MMWAAFGVVAAVRVGDAVCAIASSGIERSMLVLLNSLLELLQGSALGEAVRSAEYLYPILEATHILGIAVLVGPAFTFDLRLLGVGQGVVSVTTAARCLLPVSHIGMAIAVATGIALLSAQATVVAGTGAAPWKFGLLAPRLPQRTGVPLRHLPSRR
jgi:hypothetical protein